MSEVTVPKPEPTLTEGRIVRYVLSASDAKQINAARIIDGGKQGNTVYEGEAFPAMVVRVFPNEYVDRPGANLQVFLDGNDQLWVTSRKQGYGRYLDFGTWHWPERKD